MRKKFEDSRFKSLGSRTKSMFFWGARWFKNHTTDINQTDTVVKPMS